MKSQRKKAMIRVLQLGMLLGGLLLVKPAPAVACTGGDFYECKSLWLDEFFYPCLEQNCVGLPSDEYVDCRRECWQAYKQGSTSDCSNCPL